MNKLEVIILPYLFTALFGFIVLNLVMTFCLYSLGKIANAKQLSWYWFSLMLTFIFQGLFQEDHLPMILAYSSNVIPVVIMSMLIFKIMSRRAPVDRFFRSWLVGMILTPVLHWMGYGFTVVAMPISLAMASVPVFTGYELLIKQKKQSSSLQKFLGGLLVIAGIHFINFAIFRHQPGHQLWGWSVSMGLYQLFSVLLIALILEKQAVNEKSRLQSLVELKTYELSETLKTKESLFRMVLHDIATPIQGQLLILSMLEKNAANLEEKKKLLPKLSELSNIVKKVIDQVRSIEAVSSGKFQLDRTPVSFDKCLEDIVTVFGDQLSKKNIELNVINELPIGVMFYADRTIFTNSIMGNLISNAIKFSLPNSTLDLYCYEHNGKIMIEVNDQGIGMSEEITSNIFNPVKSYSRPGTIGEVGTGFGMSQVKTYVDHFGGTIDVKSWPVEMHPKHHGTRVTLTMDKMSCHLQ
jgi:signal transduction histidine kinase